MAQYQESMGANIGYKLTFSRYFSANIWMGKAGLGSNPHPLVILKMLSQTRIFIATFFILALIGCTPLEMPENLTVVHSSNGSDNNRVEKHPTKDSAPQSELITTPTFVETWQATQDDISSDDFGLANTRWMLVSLDSIDTSVIDETAQHTGYYPNLSFHENGRMGGFLGCNTFTGSYRLLEENKLSFHMGVVTTSACPRESQTIMEKAYIDFLAENGSVEFDNNERTLFMTTNNTNAIFERID